MTPLAAPPTVPSNYTEIGASFTPESPMERLQRRLAHARQVATGGLRDADLPPRVALTRSAALATSALCAWLLVFAFGLSGIEEHRAQHTLYAQLRQQLAEQTTPIGGAIRAGVPVALIDAPSIGLREVVVEGTSSSALRSGPGHKRNSPLPGQPGVSQIFGKSTTFGSPFGDITNLRVGESISVVTGQGRFTYSVQGVRHRGDRVTALAAGQSRLTLVTSAGTGWRRGWAPSGTVYVDATLSDKVAPVPGPRPNVVPSDEQAMKVDSGQLFPLVLWLQALIGLVVLVLWAGRRWGKVPTAMAGCVAIVALLWIVTDTAAGLLPNLV